MTETSGFLDHEGARLAWRRIAGHGPTVLWLGGFHSEMTGTKAQALADWAASAGRDYLRFDYYGHGASDGRFEDGSVSRWRADALAIIDALTEGPLVLMGSSMGGWIACLAAIARPDRVKSLVLIAPAADFTERLMRRPWKHGTSADLSFVADELLSILLAYRVRSTTIDRLCQAVGAAMVREERTAHAHRR